MSTASGAMRLGTWQIAMVLLAVTIGLITATTTPPEGVGQAAMIGLGLTAFTVLLWATAAIPPPITSIVFLIAALATQIAAPTTVFKGFLSSALWLVMGGLLIGTAAERSGFGRWVAKRFLGRFRSSYPMLILGILVGTTTLSFLIPANMGRTAITVPVVMALCREAGYAPGSNGYIGAVLTAVVGNFAVALGILPANLLNIMIVGSGEALYGVRIPYMEYLYLCGPVLGVGKGLLVWATVVRIFPAPPPLNDAGSATIEPLTAEAKRVAAILALAILLWATDFMHGIAPGWVALAAGLLCMMPGFGLLEPSEAFDLRRLGLCVWVGVVLSLGAVLTEAGASKLVSGFLANVAMVEGKSALYGSLAMSFIASLLGVIGTTGGTIPISTATIEAVAAATSLPIKTGILSITSGMSAVFFPYEAAPLVVGIGLGKVSAASAARLTVPLSILTLLIIVPLNALWWRFIGFLP